MQVDGISRVPGEILSQRTAAAAGRAADFGAVMKQVAVEQKAGELAARASGDDRRALEEAAASFEALFLQHLLQSMRKTVPKSGLIDTGFAGETFLAMLDDALAQEMAKAGGIGLAKILLDQLAP
ncbi:MAG: rod-binding protein [Clostridia bacterium]|nr:hypothetical protein [Bacillota bacterium]MBO2521872.1 hypothetical protein [Bacillota bacterium]